MLSHFLNVFINNQSILFCISIHTKHFHICQLSIVHHDHRSYIYIMIALLIIKKIYS